MHKSIRRLALPAIISNITVPLLGIVDLSIVGHLGSERYIAAIAVGSMVFNVMYWLMGFLRMGTSGLTSQALGRGDEEDLCRLYFRGLYSALAIGALFIASQWPLRHLSLFLMQVSANNAPYVSSYFNICIWGAPAMLGTYALTGWFIGMQNTRMPMVISIAQNIINIILSLTFVFALRMNIEGVALGTMLSQWIAFLMSLCLSMRLGVKTVTSWHVRGFNVLADKNPKSAANVNRDIFLRTICLVAVNLYFTSAGSAQGTMMLAVNTLLMTMFTIFSYIMDGFAFAGEALGGKLYGAGKTNELYRLKNQLVVWGVGMAAFFTLLYGLFYEQLLYLLTDQDSIIIAAIPYMPYVLLVPVVSFMAFIFDGLFIGLTLTRQMLVTCFIATAIFFSVYLSLSPTLHNSALWIAYLSFLLVRGVGQWIVFHHNEKPSHHA